MLYEGYVLYPYRRSSAKNRVRWQFGVLAPKPWLQTQGPLDETNVAGSVESWFQQTECLHEGSVGTRVTVRMRFLQLQTKAVERRTAEGFAPVDSLVVDGVRHLTFDEALPREHDSGATIEDLLNGSVSYDIDVPRGERIEPLGDAGRIVRRSWPITARLTLSAHIAPAPFPLATLRVRVENTVEDLPPDVSREEALRRTLLATHALISVDRGDLLSLLEPPQWAATAAKACANVHTFPVLVGDEGGHDLVMSSPIILYDYVKVAPESPGDLHDGGEIDEILSLRTLTLTDEEKAEARATDPRTAGIVDRVDTMPPEMMDKLHGVIRSLRPAAPEEETVLVGGVRVGKGSRVRLHPRRHGTDAQDIFLAGRTAVVNDVLHDVDGSRFVAVTLDDDPGGDLLESYGRFYHFTPDEIEALP